MNLGQIEEADKENTPDSLDFESEFTGLAKAVEKEGLAYFGGFIAHKFPQYDYLGSKASNEEDTWIGVISRGNKKLMKPSHEFLEKLKKMENLFLCHHGVEALQPGKNIVQNLADHIAQLIYLPKEVIVYYVRCRMFFRIRVLNRKIISSRKIFNKMSKL